MNLGKNDAFAGTWRCFGEIRLRRIGGAVFEGEIPTADIS